jgi:hypothetical protein
MCFNHAFIKKAFGAATPNYEFIKDVGEEARLNVVAAVIASNLIFNVSRVVFVWEQEH